MGRILLTFTNEQENQIKKFIGPLGKTKAAVIRSMVLFYLQENKGE